MIKQILAGVLVLGLVACSGKKNEETKEALNLENQQQRLSYAVGADHGHSISESGDPNYSKYKLDLITKGFEEGLKDETAFDETCQKALRGLYGDDGRSFNAEFLDEGCECLGKLSGIVFSTAWKKKGGMDELETKYVIAGFNDALHKVDTLVKQQDQLELVQNFYEELNKRIGQKMLNDAKTHSNIQDIDGLILETLQAGKGKTPSSTDKVQAQYILINAMGDTLENSTNYEKYTGQKMEPFALDAVIKGWQIGMTHMKEGGKYMLYIPYHLAYGEQGMFNPQRNSYDIQPFENLKFYIELEKVIK